ncbi:hypothetical protein CHS0354_024238 [Potamilus streckersoni]|uniref:Uncharacterized protein n=1 Tax=Potamilus streckersoni TaxID=2493646 RepID=A0AAE0SB43_9BIVA|nr:hypothetical protein CHS0354_024238 [Potamilus streckersoni]
MMEMERERMYQLPFKHTSDHYAAESLAADMDEWIVYECDKMEESLEEWLEENAPSEINRSSGVGWICISRFSERPTQDPDVMGLQQAWESLKSSGRPINKQVIMELAKNYDVLAGKWMIHVQSGFKVDQLWSFVCRGIMTHILPSFSAKVSPVNTKENGDADRHVICVYNNDFTNEDEVYELEAGLRTIGIKCPLYYKPDVYTYLGVYRNNEWGLRPTIYESMYDITKGISVVHLCD